ncbi:MAG: ABC transporter ATP-binding protein [Dehalococcoidia bacterium]|nr:ABC transporter ATP-binding protein [Dehalococcoidia bacterium]
MNTIIEARDVVKRYKDYPAVRGVSFSIDKGECFGLLGPNGAGKTTIMRMLCCVSPLTSGTLKISGTDVGIHQREIKAIIGVVPQENNLDPDLTVLQNLIVHARYFDISSRVAQERAESLLEIFQLSEKKQSRINTLSGGMKRRLILARGLINNPTVLVLDEPTTGLDPQARHFIWGRLRQLKSQGITVLISSHYMDEAYRLCDRLIILNNGEVIAEGRPAELVPRYAGREALEIDVSRTGVDGILEKAEAASAFIQRVEDTVYILGNDLEAIRSELREHSDAVLYRPTTLEDVFLRLTGRTLLQEQ